LPGAGLAAGTWLAAGAELAGGVVAAAGAVLCSWLGRLVGPVVGPSPGVEQATASNAMPRRKENPAERIFDIIPAVADSGDVSLSQPYARGGPVVLDLGSSKSTSLRAEGR
jgi:hypothetical protein